MTLLISMLGVLVLWFFVDLKLGAKRYKKVINHLSFSIRKGEIQTFCNGYDLYDELFSDIAQAKHHVHVQFYIIHNDKVSNEFLYLLKRKAKEGVTVRILLDLVGSHSLSSLQKKRLIENGVHFAYSNKPNFPFFFYTLNYRNHRKIAVIDGKSGYFGGYNIGDEHLGKNLKLGHWRDFHFKLLGEGVHDLQDIFLYDWKQATGEELKKDSSLFSAFSKGEMEYQFFPTNGVTLQSSLLTFIQQAEHEIHIGSPYYIPSKVVNEALIAASKRGVSVTILVPFRSDHLFVKEAAFPFFKSLLHAGVNIFQYTNGFYHGKLIVIDNTLCDIGTANFDKRSFFINDELNCFVFDNYFIQKIKNEYFSDLHDAVRLTLDSYQKRPFWQRGKEMFSTLISDYL